MYNTLLKFLKFLRNYIAFTFFLITVTVMVYNFWPTLVKEGTFLVLKFENTELNEYDQPDFLSLKPQASLQKIRNILNQVKDDPKIKGIVLEIYGARMGYAHAQEIRRLLSNCKNAGKSIHVFADTFGEGENATAMYYIASVADKIWIQSIGELNFNGLVAERWFAKTFLDKYKIKAHIEKRDKYKSAIEWALRDNFSPEARENWKSILDDMLAIVIRDVAHSRDLAENYVKECIDRAPLMDKEAIECKLIDKIDTRKNLYDMLEGPFMNFYKYPIKNPGKKRNKLTIVYLDGVIQRYNPDDMGANLCARITDKSAIRLIQRAVDDGSRAIVIRINSGGGSATASESIFQMLKWAKEVKNIPIVVSMSNAAASGGYLIALAGNKIIAEETTLTGSIGVFMGRVTTEGLWNEYGIHWDHIATGENANCYITSVEPTAKQIEKLKNSTDYIYEWFLERVKANRPLKGDVKNLAGGKVFTGRQARQHLLVDDIGGLDKAIDAALELAEIKREDTTILEYPGKGLGEFIANMRDEGIVAKLMSCFVKIDLNATTTVQ